MSTTPPIPGSTPQGFAASARLDNAGRVFRRRDDRDPVVDLQSLLDRVPAVVARVHRSTQGHWSVPFASSDFARLCGIGLPALRDDARWLCARIHADDLARLRAAWALHGELLRSLTERIRVRRPGVLSVDDSGVGLSAQQLEKIFEPYNRFGTDSADASGSGLGLVIARKLVRAMGGEIDALSRVGRGSRFTVSLPLAKSEVLRAAPPAAQPDEPSAWDAGAHPVVMCVEHDEVNAALMQQIFSTQPNWRLLSASSGSEALKLAQQHELSRILLDLNLPGMSGFEVRERLKSDARTREVRCIAFSADVSPQQIEHALAQGFDDYWTQPTDVAVLVAKLKCEFRALGAFQGSNSGDLCR